MSYDTGRRRQSGVVAQLQHRISPQAYCASLRIIDLTTDGDSRPCTRWRLPYHDVAERGELMSREQLASHEARHGTANHEVEAEEASDLPPSILWRAKALGPGDGEALKMLL